MTAMLSNNWSLYRGCVNQKLLTGPRNAPAISFPLNLRTALSGAKFPFKMNEIFCSCPKNLYKHFVAGQL